MSEASATFSMPMRVGNYPSKENKGKKIRKQKEEGGKKTKKRKGGG